MPSNTTGADSHQPSHSLLTNIFGRIWAFWGLITFALSFLIIFIPSMLAYLMREPKGQDYFIGVSRVWMWCWLHLVGCPVKVTGKQHFKKGMTYVVVFNHNALIDVPLSAPFIPAGNKTIAKASFAKVPLFGWFYRKGSVLVDRKSNQSRRKSYEAMKAVLQNHMHMCIYPEGTRNRTKEPLKAFHDGAFKLAVDAKKDIMPAVILGTKRAMPATKPFFLLPTRLEMHFLEPVSSEHVDADTLKDKVFNIMLTEIVQSGKN